jgi:oligopeptide/dipeptide ABC transporter ATP-binding protein
MSLLEISDLHVEFAQRGLDNRLRVARALNGVSLEVAPAEILGLVGETGAGKSLTASVAMGLLAPGGRVARGSIRFQGRELLGLSERELCTIRGQHMAMIVQSPLTSLDPLMRVGDQLVRMQRLHGRVPAGQARARALATLEAVRIPDPERRMRAWPHELSGGMAQRVLIAMALVNEPALIVADEPTTGLDVTVQAQVLDTLRELVRARGLGALVITHDLGVVAHYCERIAVMFAGQVVEDGKVRDVFAHPAHPYTRALIGSTPGHIAREGYRDVGGTPPDLYALPEGCLYRDRCPIAAPICRQLPPRVAISETQGAACHFAGPVPP